ncbi:MAG: tRNA (adenosine(37)-N6)-threonylcarbamoyltransferase complex ATPase subunit type 1 TsaE [Acidobacteria bacterium]|nr:tRNA (adenosine(37)-N6)-threonylcarbamoyltransferase complex ATPase subunit type 1 TsaE [Acidobacteriota bacterium]
MTGTVVTESEEQTAAAGERLAGNLRPGDVVLLFGDLGAGKTAFVRGLASGLGASGVAIEWAERWKGRPDDAVEVGIEDLGEDTRRIRWSRR